MGEGLAFLGLGAALVALGFVLVWALVRVSDKEPSALVTITLGLLTLVAVGAFVLTDSDILGTIAATGFGALAGAVTNVFDRPKRGQPPARHLAETEPAFDQEATPASSPNRTSVPPPDPPVTQDGDL